MSGVDEATIVPWWSFTKTVIAATALALVRDGRLALDTPLPTGYTLRQLLQHRAGLPDYGPLRDYHAAVARHEDAWARRSSRSSCSRSASNARASEPHAVPCRPGRSWFHRA